ncbi:MAG TPA: DUF503 domain-containing protein [Dehalococcoidia bacterium]|nr:DUF503 domain-containing protein [Dehalococcoidia bacterium]
MMTVGLCRIWLRLPENHSLKGKRQAVRSLTARLQNRFNVSVAEVDDHDLWQMVSLGVSCVTNSERHAHEVLTAVVEYIRSQRLDMELVDYRTEVIRALNEGRY